MKRPLRWYDHLTISINWFALTTRSQVLAPLVIPLLVQRFVGEEFKGTYVGTIRLWALMVAILIQALMGILSDRSHSRFGRRRPFIFLGAILESIVILLIGFSAKLEGMTGFWILFALYILSMVGANISHAATQGLIPDLVPENKRGLFSGIKAFLELPLPLVFVSFVISSIIARGDIFTGLLCLIGVLLTSMALTMLVPEVPQGSETPKMDLAPFIRLLSMTAVFTAVILAVGAVVNIVTAAAQSLSQISPFLLVGITGSLGMLAAVVLGVSISLKIGLNQENENQSSFRWWVVNRLAFLVAANNLAAFLVFFLQEKFPQFQGDAAAQPAARIVMFVGIFIILTSLPSGFLADRYGNKTLILVSGVLTSIGTVVVVLSPTLEFIYLGGAVIGSGVGMFYSANWALGTKLVPADRAGQFLGLSNLAGAGAGAIGAYIGGPIADNTSYVLLLSIYSLIAFSSIFALAGIDES